MRWPEGPSDASQLPKSVSVRRSICSSFVQQHKAAFRVELAHDGRCHAQLVRTRHIAPALALISERAVVHGEPRQREVGAVQKGAAFLPLGINGIRQRFVLVGITPCFIFSARLVQVGADFPVDLLGVSDTGFQFRRAFVLQVLSGFFEQSPGLSSHWRTVRLPAAAERPGCPTLLQILYMLRQLRRAFTLALIFAVAGQYLLLAADQLGYTDRLIRSIVVFHLLLSKMFFLFCDLPNGGAAVVQRADLPVECRKTVSDADDFQRRVGLFPVVHIHEAWQVERQLFHELVQQLLAALTAGRVGHRQRTVFPRRSTTSPLRD